MDRDVADLPKFEIDETINSLRATASTLGVLPERILATWRPRRLVETTLKTSNLAL